MSANARTGAVERTTAESGVVRGAGGDHLDRAEVLELAARFESMLLVQMIREMRQSAKWEGETDAGGLGAETYFETLDHELANHLSSVAGLGLSGQMVEAIARASGSGLAAATVTGGAARASRGYGVPDEQSAPSAAGDPLAGSIVQPAETSARPFAVAPGAVTSSYGWRRDPFTGQARFHRGIDLRATYGEEVQAAGGGRVAFSGEQGGYGTTVLIEHANGVQTRYAHLSAAIVQAGEMVSAGQVIGRAGRSGRATGTHVHFEVTVNGRHVSPSDAGLTSAVTPAAGQD